MIGLRPTISAVSPTMNATANTAGTCASSNSEDSCSTASAFHQSHIEISSEVDETHHLACRVCWDWAGSDLVSPCSCKGTQKYVHVKCLRRWQDNVLKRDSNDERAYRCGVCRSPYSLAPPRDTWPTRLCQVLRSLGAAACVSLMAFGLSSPPWPHLALLVLLLMGSRNNALLAATLVVSCTLAALHAKGMRVIVHINGGRHVALALIRHGAAVDGLGPGTLLVASEDLNQSMMFRQSVVLVYEHSMESGARGVIVTQPLRTPPPAVRGLGAFMHGNDGTSKYSAKMKSAGPRHYLGGPVGIPGEGMRQELAVLHTLAGIAGASNVAPPGLYQGGALAEVLEKSALLRRRREGQVLLFHGVSTWAAGQLEGEIRAGFWGVAAARDEDVLSVPPEELWESLTASDRPAWVVAG